MSSYPRGGNRWNQVSIGRILCLLHLGRQVTLDNQLDNENLCLLFNTKELVNLGAEQNRSVTNRDGQLDLPSSDPAHIHRHLNRCPSPLFHPYFGLTIAACESGEGGDGNVSFEVVNFLSDFENLPCLKSLVSTLVRSGIPEAVVAVTTPLQCGSSVC